MRSRARDARRGLLPSPGAARKPRALTAPANELAKYLADRPGQAVTAEEAAAALDLPYGWNSLAGALGALGNYLSNREIDFPWSAITDADDERVRLTMDEGTAAAVKQVL